MEKCIGNEGMARLNKVLHCVGYAGWSIDYRQIHIDCITTLVIRPDVGNARVLQYWTSAAL